MNKQVKMKEADALNAREVFRQNYVVVLISHIGDEKITDCIANRKEFQQAFRYAKNNGGLQLNIVGGEQLFIPSTDFRTARLRPITDEILAQLFPIEEEKNAKGKEKEDKQHSGVESKGKKTSKSSKAETPKKVSQS